MLRAIAMAAVLTTGCLAEVEPPPDRGCPTGLPYLFRRDGPRPIGRMYACEACVMTETICDRRLPCTLTGACDYAALVARWESMDCDYEDPCVRPDPAHYWRPEGD